MKNMNKVLAGLMAAGLLLTTGCASTSTNSSSSTSDWYTGPGYDKLYEELGKATENYVSSDIKFLCDESSRKALKENTRITKSIVLETIRNNKPSISVQELNNYLAIKSKMEGENNNNDRPRIGFRT